MSLVRLAAPCVIGMRLGEHATTVMIEKNIGAGIHRRRLRNGIAGLGRSRRGRGSRKGQVQERVRVQVQCRCRCRCRCGRGAASAAADAIMSQANHNERDMPYDSTNVLILNDVRF